MPAVKKEKAATIIAVIFHIIGIVGILFFDKDFFIKTTAINLLLMFALILYTQKEINRGFILFFFIAVLVGIGVEIIGTNTGYLFGNYRYGSALGLSFMNVPLIIGINWFVTIYCCGVGINMLLNKLVSSLADITETQKPLIKLLSVVVDGATLAVAFDWLMEPVAIKLGYWKWLGTGEIPFYNYVCWFVISIVLLTIFNLFTFDKRNKFAVHLLLIQAMFFLLLRTFL
jgi:putative membrane protein